MATSRVDMVKDHGEMINYNCDKCGSSDKKHLNDVKARISYLPIIISIVIAIMVTMILWNFVYAVSTLSILIPIFAYQQQSNDVNGFNRYRI